MDAEGEADPSSWPTWVPCVHLMRTRKLVKDKKAALQLFKGARVRDPFRGVGTVEELLEDGGARILLASGEERTYTLKQMKRFSSAYDASQDATYTCKYLKELAGGVVKREDLVLTPVAVHAQLSQQYLLRVVMEGWTHEQARHA